MFEKSSRIQYLSRNMKIHQKNITCRGNSFLRIGSDIWHTITAHCSLYTECSYTSLYIPSIFFGPGKIFIAAYSTYIHKVYLYLSLNPYTQYKWININILIYDAYVKCIV